MAGVGSRISRMQFSSNGDPHLVTGVATVDSSVGPLELAAGRLAVEVSEPTTRRARCARPPSPFAAMFV
jgi:hypothetical protein